MPIKSLSHRPQRADFPTDDGIDDIQLKYAQEAFEVCSQLRIVCLDDGPLEASPTCVAGRAWVRKEGRKDISQPEAVLLARMASRHALSDLLTEYWRDRW
jgi:hypothetical protein